MKHEWEQHVKPANVLTHPKEQYKRLWLTANVLFRDIHVYQGMSISTKWMWKVQFGQSAMPFGFTNKDQTIQFQKKINLVKIIFAKTPQISPKCGWIAKWRDARCITSVVIELESQKSGRARQNSKSPTISRLSLRLPDHSHDRVSDFQKTELRFLRISSLDVAKLWREVHQISWSNDLILVDRHKS